MITSLLIDDIEFLPYLLFDETNRLKFEIDEGVNSPLCPIYEFSLENRDGLEEVFLKNYPYEMFTEGHVELYNDELKVFDGYIDKNNSRIYKNAESMQIYAVSIDKKIGSDLARYDITQLYYNKDGSIPVRQRGGREGITERYDYTQYYRIDDLIETILDDINISDKVLFSNTGLFGVMYKYRYNEEKFGPIAERQTIGVYRNTGDRGKGSPFYNTIVEYRRNETDTESYDTLMKEFAKIAGCCFYYEPRIDKYVFMQMNSFYNPLGWSVLEIDDKILYDPDDDDYEIPIIYRDAYNGLIVEFDDVSLLVKLGRNGNVLSYEWGIDAQEYEIVQFPNNEYYLVLTEEEFYRIGETEFKDSLYIENGLKVKMNGKLTDYYYKGGPVMDRIDHFLYNMISSYYFLLYYSRELELRLNGLYFAPMIVKMNNNEHACWYSETDFNTNETLIKIITRDYEPEQPPAESFLVVEDDVFVLD